MRIEAMKERIEALMEERMRYSLDERQIARLKPLVLGHTAARFIELPTRLGSVAPWDKVVRVLQADGLEIGRITMGEAFALKQMGGMSQKEYLGDSVYAAWDGNGVILTTENGLPGDPSNEIYIEDQVWKALKKFVDRIKRGEI